MGRNRTIALAADHRGFELKEKIARWLKAKRFRVVDVGTHSSEPCDYPDYVLRAAEAVRKGEVARAVAVCHSGIGSSIAANKVKRVRAALVQSVVEARLSRAHNDSNLLVLGSGFVRPPRAKRIIETWLKTPFEGGRHARRIRKITNYERGKNG